MIQQHTVQKGDTLSDIAKKYNAQISDISGYRSGDIDLIYPDEVLNIGSSTPVSTLENTKTTTFAPQPIAPESLIPDFDFTANIEERGTISSEIEALRSKKRGIYEGAIERFDELVPDRAKLGDIQTQLEALKVQRGAIPTGVAERYRGRGVTESAMGNITSQELSRNALASTDLQTQGMLLQGNINTALDLIQQSVDLELQPIQDDLDYNEANLDRLIDSYKDEEDKYSKGVIAEAKAEKERIDQERNDLKDLRSLRTDLRLIANTARQGGASSSVVQQIMGTDSYAEALRLATGYLDLTEAEKLRKETYTAPGTTTPEDTSWIDDL